MIEQEDVSNLNTLMGKRYAIFGNNLSNVVICKITLLRAYFSDGNAFV